MPRSLPVMPLALLLTLAPPVAADGPPAARAPATPDGAPAPAGGDAAEGEPAAAPFDDGALYSIRYPDWFNAQFFNLRDDANDAAEAGKQGVFLFFSTEGCSYCHLFIERTLGDPAVAARLQAHFYSLGFEIFSDAELVDFLGGTTRVNSFAQANGVQFAPTLMFFGNDGRRLVRLSGFYGPADFQRVLDWLLDGHHETLTLREYLAGDRPQADARSDAALRADPLFAPPPYALDRRQVPGGRPLLVLFETTDCEDCETFHRRVLGNAEIRARLGRLDLVRLNASDGATPVLAPDGQRTNPRAWFAALGFSRTPALAFFNEAGAAVLTTDALVLESRMQNSLGFVLDRAWARGWSYQRYARDQAAQKAAGADAVSPRPLP